MPERKRGGGGVNAPRSGSKSPQRKVQPREKATQASSTRDRATKEARIAAASAFKSPTKLARPTQDKATKEARAAAVAVFGSSNTEASPIKKPRELEERPKVWDPSTRTIVSIKDQAGPSSSRILAPSTKSSTTLMPGIKALNTNTASEVAAPARRVLPFSPAGTSEASDSSVPGSITSEPSTDRKGRRIFVKRNNIPPSQQFLIAGVEEPKNNNIRFLGLAAGQGGRHFDLGLIIVVALSRNGSHYSSHNEMK